MSSSPRTDSPIIPIFPQRLSEPLTSMESIAEQPQTFLYSPTIASPELAESGHPYTFLDSSSSGKSSPSKSSSAAKADSALLPHERFPSCLSLQNLGYEYEYDENDSDEGEEWSEGWNISSFGTSGQASQDIRPLYQRELPEVQEFAFAYYPEPVMGNRSKENNGSLKVARRRLVRSRKGEIQGKRFRAWFKRALGKLRLGGRQ